MPRTRARARRPTRELIFDIWEQDIARAVFVSHERVIQALRERTEQHRRRPPFEQRPHLSKLCRHHNLTSLLESYLALILQSITELSVSGATSPQVLSVCAASKNTPNNTSELAPVASINAALKPTSKRLLRWSGYRRFTPINTSGDATKASTPTTPTYERRARPPRPGDRADRQENSRGVRDDPSVRWTMSSRESSPSMVEER